MVLFENVQIIPFGAAPTPAHITWVSPHAPSNAVKTLNPQQLPAWLDDASLRSSDCPLQIATWQAEAARLQAEVKHPPTWSPSHTPLPSIPGWDSGKASWAG